MAPGTRAYGAQRLRGFSTTIFAEMSELAAATGSLNLGQGFPDTDGPPELAEVAVAAIRAGRNQYPPSPGIPELRQAVGHPPAGLVRAGRTTRTTRCWSPSGATEAIAATLLALCEPGDEVVMFEPSYDSYAACASMAGAVPRLVRLHTPDWHFDPDELAAAIGPTDHHDPAQHARTTRRARSSTPTSWPRSPRCAVEHDLLAVTDEVYEHLVFEGTHRPLAALPGHARAHRGHLVGRQDLLLHRVEGGLGHGQRRRWWPPSARPSSS